MPTGDTYGVAGAGDLVAVYDTKCVVGTAETDADDVGRADAEGTADALDEVVADAVGPTPVHVTATRPASLGSARNTSAAGAEYDPAQAPASDAPSAMYLPAYAEDVDEERNDSSDASDSPRTAVKDASSTAMALESMIPSRVASPTLPIGARTFDGKFPE